MLDGFKQQKRMLRTEIRNYIVFWQTDLEVNYKMNIPNNVKNMPKREFEVWLETVSRQRVPQELKGLLVEYDCTCNNIQSMEKGYNSEC